MLLRVVKPYTLAQKFAGTCFQKVDNFRNQKTVFIGMHGLKSSLVAKRPKMTKKRQILRFPFPHRKL